VGNERPSSNGPPHVSASQLDMLSRCGEQYRRVYLEGERLPPGIALVKGTGLHGGAETNFRQKIDSHADMKLRDIVDASVAAYDEAIAGGVSFTPGEANRGAGLVLAEGRDDVAELATVHAKHQAPQYQPLAVEQEVRLELPGKPLLGYVDLIAEANYVDGKPPAEKVVAVVDLKTSGKRKSQREADTSTQLTVYAAAAPTLGIHADEMRLDVLVQTAGGTHRQVLSTQRDSRDYAALAARLNAYHAILASGTFVPASPLSWWCSPRWCGFFRTCPYVIGQEKVQDEQ
jgi:CRISPR/Cas system-associated exonuclease Cas4 (RecB family)